MGLFDKGPISFGFVNDLFSNPLGSALNDVGTRALLLKKKQEMAALKKQIQSDKTIDEVSRTELLQLFPQNNSIPNLASISSIFADARKGEGKYAVRRINQAQRESLIDRPGRQQTVLSQGSLV